MKYLKIIFTWLFRRETLSNAIFAINIAKEIFTNRYADDENKNKAILRKLEIAQNAIDSVQKYLPNNETEKYAVGINKSNDKKTWGDFTAVVVKDKHGKGKNGIDLGLNTQALGVPVNFTYDPNDGSAKGKVGPFTFNI